MDAKTRDNLKAAYLNVGNVELEAGRHEQALEALRQALELDPDYSLAHFALGVTYHAQSEALQEDVTAKLLTQAETHLKRAIAENPGLIEAYHLLATVLKDLGREDERAQWLERAAGRNSANPQTWQNLGAAYRALQRWSDAAKAYEKALDLAPDDSEIPRALARVYYRLGDWKQAAAYFERAVASGKIAAEDYNSLGVARLFLKQPAAALEAVEQAVKSAPQNAVYQSNRGLLLVTLKRNEEAEAAYRRAIELDPDYATPWNGLGNVLVELKQPEEAEAAYRRAIELDPNNAWGYGNLGWLFYRQNHLEKAIAGTERALALAPNDPMLPYNLALFHLVAGQTDRALDLYAGTLAPDADRSRLDDAITDLHEALEENPALKPAHLALGLLHQARRDAEAAATAYQRLLTDTTDLALRRRAEEQLATLAEDPEFPSA
jgi:tetratricopeptide (TPR) repeat protein